MKIMLANFAKMIDDSGGLAKVTCAFANEMARRGHNVSLVYCDGRNGDFFYPVTTKAKYYDLCIQNGNVIKMPWQMIFKREFLRLFSKVNSRDVNDQFMQKYLKSYMTVILDKEKPDVIISSQPAASRIFLCDIKTQVPVITMSHGDPEDYFHTYPKGEIPALGKSSACQVLLPSFVEPIKKRFPTEKVVVIGNVVPQYEEQADLASEKNHYKIIFVGRLVKNHKRPHLLIKAFASLAAKYPQWQVELWGAESNKAYTKSLNHLIKEYHLAQQVFLKGITKNVASVLKQGDIFVLPSAYEGFGLSLAEGMSIGLPAIGYKSCPAVNELIQSGENGMLCDDGVEPLSMALEKLMIDKALRVKLGQQARASMQQYAADIIWGKWEKLIKDVVNN